MNDKPLVLVCDDESHIVHVVSLKLRNAGYEVQTAQDGAEGLELARQRTPDLLITDYQMPRMNGVELCAAFREDAALAKVPAMMLTARGFRLDPLEVRRARIAEVLSKPFSPREVLSKVQELLAANRPDQPEDEAAIEVAA
ncbi:MAG: response regulator [Planctomycetota bacterium]